METPIHSLVDFIDDKTYEIETREMEIPIDHTYGYGMILPRVIKPSIGQALPYQKKKL